MGMGMGMGMGIEPEFLWRHGIRIAFF
jgi:hypothetical protein